MKSNLDIEITNRCKEFSHKFEKVLHYIQKYNKIAVFRHARPDYDALGCQMAMVSWLKDNFPTKDIIYVGEDHVTLTPSCFPYMMNVDDSWFKEPFLAIILDTSTKARVADERFEKAQVIIKIDHHPEVDRYGKINIVDESMSAAGELLANMLIKFIDYKISKETATYLFKAVVGDSNRFLYQEVNAHTFAIAEYLVQHGAPVAPTYKEMYSNKDISSLNLAKWVLDHYQITEKGVAYYILEKDVLETLHVQPERGKECLGLFDHFDFIKIWMSISWDEPKGNYRVSIRSNSVNIDGVATKYNGGGHSQASGAKLKTLEELPNLLKDLDNLLN